MNNKIRRTVFFYEKNAPTLIKNYENADMSFIHEMLVRFVHPKFKILEIGFGSGRDMRFLLQQGFEVWGVDPSSKFVKQLKRHFKKNRKRIFRGSLPNLSLPKQLEHYFDMILLIAVWMHIPKRYYKQSIQTIDKYIKTNGIVFLSYSLGRRKEKYRFFEDVDPKYVNRMFREYGYNKIDEFVTDDATPMQREIKWITQIYRKTS